MPHAIKQLLFDCDNTLVLSEELAFEACADLTNEILENHGLADRYTGDQLIVDFVGQNFRGMMTSLQAKYGFKMEDDEVQDFVKREEDAVIAKLVAKAEPCVNSMPVLQKLFDEKKYGMAVVSSSALRRVRASIAKVDQAKYFPHEHVYSAATSLPEPTTKPDPAIYLYAMEQLGVQPEECIAIEDSKSGATAAIRANIPCVAYVGSYPTKHKQDQIATDLLKLGCKKVMHDWIEFDFCLSQIERM